MSESIAQSKISLFQDRFLKGKDASPAHYELAIHSVFPLGITVDMLYQLWHNFKDFNGIPMLAVSDVLLSPLFREVGNGIFEPDKEARILLLDEMRVRTTDLFGYDGQQRLIELALFTKKYAEERLTGDAYKSFRETLIWNANATADPIAALQAISKRYAESLEKQNRSEIMRLRDLLEQFALQEMGKQEANFTKSTFFPFLQQSIAIKGVYMNAPSEQIRSKWQGASNEKVLTYSHFAQPDAIMIPLPLMLKDMKVLENMTEMVEQQNTETEKKQVLALIIGINDYQSPIPKLQGAMNDGAKIETWLNAQFANNPSDIVLKTTKIFDRQATKEAILKGFKNQAALAKAGDFVLFSFSGFGVLVEEKQEVKQMKQVKKGQYTDGTSRDNREGGYADLKERIRKLIGDGKIEKAINESLENEQIKNGDSKNDFIGLKAQYSQLQRDENLGLIAYGDGNKQRSKITNVLLNLIDDIETDANCSEKSKKQAHSVMLPYDSKGKDTTNGICGEEFLEIIKQYPDVNFVFFLDACYCYCFFLEITENLVVLINYSEGEMGMEMAFEGLHQGVFTYQSFKILTEKPQLTYAQLIEAVNVETQKGTKPQTALLQCRPQNRHKMVLKQRLERDKVLPTIYAIFEGDEKAGEESAAYFSKFLSDNQDAARFNLNISFKQSDITWTKFKEEDIILIFTNYPTTDVNIKANIHDFFGKTKHPVVFINEGTNTSPFDKEFDTKLIQICASSPNEKAKSLSTKNQKIGLFTQKLIEVLKYAEKPLTYSDVFSRVYTKVTQQTDGQHPQIQTFGKSETSDLFLGGILKAQNMEHPDSFGTEGGILQKMTVGFSETVDKKFRQLVIETFKKEGKSKFFDLLDTDDSTDYVIQFDKEKKQYTLETTVGNALMFPPTRGQSYELITFFNNIDRVANWQYTLTLNGNPRADIDLAAIKIQFTNLGFDKKTRIESDGKQPIMVAIEANKETYFSLSVKNEGKKAVYVSISYLGKDTSISNQFLSLKQIKTDETAWFEFEKGKEIPIMIQPEFLAQGKTSLTEYIKVFISTESFSTDEFNQDALSLEIENKRGLTDAPTIIHKGGWETKNVAVKTLVLTLQLK